MDEQKAPMANKSDAEANKWMGVLSYLGVLCLIPFFAAKKSAFAQHHAKQGLVLFLIVVISRIATTFLPWAMEDTIDSIVSLAAFVLSIMGIMNAWKGTMWDMPVVGGLTKSIFKK